MTIGTFYSELDDLLAEEGPEETPEVDKTVEALTEEIDDMTPEALAGHIRELVLDGRKARRNRASKRGILKNDLRALAQWEREITLNYGVSK